MSEDGNRRFTDHIEQMNTAARDMVEQQSRVLYLIGAILLDIVFLLAFIFWIFAFNSYALSGHGLTPGQQEAFITAAATIATLSFLILLGLLIRMIKGD